MGIWVLFEFVCDFNCFAIWYWIWSLDVDCALLLRYYLYVFELVMILNIVLVGADDYVNPFKEPCGEGRRDTML